MSEWLPEMVCVNPWTACTYEKLYDIFCREIRDQKPVYKGNEVWIFPELEENKELIFWHLTTRKEREKSIPRRKLKFCQKDQPFVDMERLPDFRRCERLSWVNAVIEHSDSPEVINWDYEESDGTVKTYLWHKDEDFVVIMKKYPDGKRRLVTSFYVDSDYTRRDFERKYANRIK